MESFCQLLYSAFHELVATFVQMQIVVSLAFEAQCQVPALHVEDRLRELFLLLDSFYARIPQRGKFSCTVYIRYTFCTRSTFNRDITNQPTKPPTHLYFICDNK